jgi:hypothetical protein
MLLKSREKAWGFAVLCGNLSSVVPPTDAFQQLITNAVRTAVRQELAAFSPKIAPRWLDLEHAAALMSTTKDGVRGMLRAGLFPARKMGARLMIDTKDLEKAFAENTVWLNAKQSPTPLQKAA